MQKANENISSCSSLSYYSERKTSSTDKTESDLDDSVIMEAVAYERDSFGTDEVYADEFRAQIRRYEALMPTTRLPPIHFIRTFCMTPSRFETPLSVFAPWLKPQLSPKAIQGRASTK